MSTTMARAPVNEEEFLGALYKGGELLGAGKLVEARQQLERAHGLAPKNEKAQNLLGLTYFKLGLFDQASSIYEKLVNENPADPTLRVNLGLVYLKTNNLPRCIKEFETATDLDPEHKKAHNYLGLALAQAGDYGKAREHFVLAGSDQMAEKMSRALTAKVESAPSSHGLVVPSAPPATATAVTAQPARPTAPPAPSPADDEIEVMSDAEEIDGEAPPEVVSEPIAQTMEAVETPVESIDVSTEPLPQEVDVPMPASSGPRLDRDWGAQFGMDAGSAEPVAEELPMIEADAEVAVVEESTEPKQWATPGIHSWEADGETKPVTDDRVMETTLDPAAEDPAWQAAREASAQQAAAAAAAAPAADDMSWNRPPDPASEMDFGGVAPTDSTDGRPTAPDASGDYGAEPPTYDPHATPSVEAAYEQPAEPPTYDPHAVVEGTYETNGVDPNAAYDANAVDPNAAYDANAVDANAAYDANAVDPNAVYDGATVDPNAAYDAGAVDPNAVYDGATDDPNAAYDANTVDPNAAYDANAVDPNAAYDANAVDPNAAYDANAVDPNAAYDANAVDPNAAYDANAVDPNASYDAATADPNASYDAATADPNAGYDANAADPNATYETDPNGGYDANAVDPNATYDAAATDPNAGYDVNAADPNAEYAAATEDAPAEDAWDAEAVQPLPSGPLPPVATTPASAPEPATNSGAWVAQPLSSFTPADAPPRPPSPSTPTPAPPPSAPTLYSPMQARTLVELGASTSTIDEPQAGPFHVGPHGLAISVNGEMLSRMTNLVAIVGSVNAEPERRRARGRSTDQAFGDGATQMQRLSGHGVVHLEMGGARFHALDLNDDSAYLREERVFGFEESISFEHGRLSMDDNPLSLDLVHLSGDGRVLLQLNGAMKSLAVPPGAPMVVPLQRLVGWFGRVTPRLTGFAGQGAVELTGDGFALLVAPG